MKINTSRQPYKKLIIITCVVALLALLSYGVYATTTKHWPFTTKHSDSTTEPSDSTSTYSKNSSKVPVEPRQTTTSDTTEPPSPKTPDNEDSPTKPSSNELGLIITSIMNQDSAVQVRSLIEAVTSSGTCTLTFSKGDLVVTKTSGIQALPSSSTCKGFTISQSELSPGIWNVTLKATSEARTGSDSTTFEVK